MKRILITEDDNTLALGLCRALSSEEVIAESCNSINNTRRKLDKEQFELLLLDVNLPDENGFDFLREVKTKYNMSVIMLTANDLETDIVSGLEQGADDYIIKPFSLAILRARVKNQLRGSPIASTTRFVSGRYFFDFHNLKFTVDGKAVELSKTEQKLLSMLTDNVGNTLTRDVLINKVWSDGADYVDENALSVTINRLRSKLSARECIKTIYGTGYTWVKNDR